MNTKAAPIPIFYACDDRFVKYTVVSLFSIIKNRDPRRSYEIYVLNTDISRETQQLLLSLASDGVSISFVDVSPYLQSIASRLPLRDYYSKTTYFRLFIADMFPALTKAIYIDSDTVVQGDISALYDTDIGENLVGACHEQVMVQNDIFGTYAEQVVGVCRHNFFNAGVLLLNCTAWRESKLLDRFFALLDFYHFAVTQDEDYLNLLCKDHVYWLDQRWNTEMEGDIDYPIAEAHVLHYIMVNKPWHYGDCRHGDIFWQYAKETAVFETMQTELANYRDEQKMQDSASAERLCQLAIAETNREDNYLRLLNRTKRAPDRVEALEKIAMLELEGRFTEDVENDPPAPTLMPEDIDYLRKSWRAKLKQRHAYFLAKKFLAGILKEKKLIVKNIIGAEHWQALEGGAIITCNHFNALDSFAMQMAYMASGHKKKKLFRVIREGNYTAFPGFYGYLMRNFYTLPLSSNAKTMKKFVKATETLLKEGHFVLVYPEQSMWWNYRKPKPLQKGAFSLAAKSGVPVLPCFITMQDSTLLGEDGYPVQEYTLHISAPIYPDKEKGYAENVAYLLFENARIWQSIYEKEYHMPLYYTTKKTAPQGT